MASLIYDSCIFDTSKGDIDWDNHSFKMLLVGTGYTPNKATHTNRSHVTSEVTGTNYSAGGIALSITGSGPVNDTGNHWTTVTFANPQYPNLTVTGIRAGVIYKTTGTNTTDLLVAYVDFLSSYSPAAQNFNVTFTTPLKWANTT